MSIRKTLPEESPCRDQDLTWAIIGAEGCAGLRLGKGDLWPSMTSVCLSDLQALLPDKHPWLDR